MVRSLVCLVAFADAVDSRADERIAANPIRRLAAMLQMMQEEVTSEGKKERELFDKLMCY